MRITSKGQVTIPFEIREKLGLYPTSFQVVGDAVRIKKAQKTRRRGTLIVDHLRARATARMSTDEILALTRGPR